MGCLGGGCGDKEASYSFPSGQGPGGGVSRPLGKRRRSEPEPLRKRRKGKEELGPSTAAHSRHGSQEQREQAHLRRALQVQGQGESCWANWWDEKDQGPLQGPSGFSYRPQCLHPPPALTRAIRAAAATTSGPQMPAVCPGQCLIEMSPSYFHSPATITCDSFPSSPSLLNSCL